MTRKRMIFTAGLAVAGFGSLALAQSSVIVTATFRLWLWIVGASALWLSFFMFRRPPHAPRELAKALGSYFTTTATVLFTSVFLFLLVNLTLDAALKITKRLDLRSSIQHFEQYGDRVYEPYATLSLTHQDVQRLLIECFQRPIVYESFTQFRERPFHGRFVNVDPAGFRDSKNGAPWPPASENLNIFVFGGSTTFGYGMPDDQTIPAHLQRLIDKVELPRRVMVYNFGAGFYFSTQERILFENLLLAGQRPDVIVFIDGINDAGNSDGNAARAQELRKIMERRIASRDFFLADPGGIIENLPIRRLLNYVSSSRFSSARAAGAGQVAGLAKDRDGRGGSAVQENEAKGNLPLVASAPATLDRYATNQRIIRDIALEFGIRTVFVWQPSPAYEYDLRYDIFQKGIAVPGSPDQRRFEAVYGLMARRLEAVSPQSDFLYLADLQKGRRENFYVDELHYTSAFSVEIAREILEHLRRRDLLR